MSDRTQPKHSITRRGLIRAAISSLTALPAIGGVGIFSQERVARALTSEEAGASFTNEELAKITVIRRNQMAIVAVDMSKVEHVVISNGGLESGTIPPREASWSRRRRTRGKRRRSSLPTTARTTARRPGRGRGVAAAELPKTGDASPDALLALLLAALGTSICIASRRVKEG